MHPDLIVVSVGPCGGGELERHSLFLPAFVAERELGLQNVFPPPSPQTQHPVTQASLASTEFRSAEIQAQARRLSRNTLDFPGSCQQAHIGDDYLGGISRLSTAPRILKGCGYRRLSRSP